MREALALHELPESVDFFALTGSGIVALSCDTKFYVLHKTSLARFGDIDVYTHQIGAVVAV